ncbi:helix-turn-helix domain-containing protein [Melghirimyces algeriensis]|uniref:Helix-turn-helix domain-containing protein n=1 Tax=Melghirimyces algeriensis TaxID=910412 RepID=A0A521EXZ4_9BACL|nr:Helix-turn-helix domain-containing protein [Melghirimyces algeriensis]
MHKAFKFRIYPTKEQATLINKSFPLDFLPFDMNHYKVIFGWNWSYKAYFNVLQLINEPCMLYYTQKIRF